MIYEIETHEARDTRKNAVILPKWKALCEWHKWFAWYPVLIASDKKAWLCYVERRLKESERKEPVKWYNYHLIHSLPSFHFEYRIYKMKNTHAG